MRKTMSDSELCMLLGIRVPVQRVGGISTSVFAVQSIRGLVVHAFPGLRGSLLSSEKAGDDLCFLAVPSEITVVAVKIACRVV